MSAPEIRLILCDLDGTLIDSAPDLCQAVTLALAEVSLPGHDVDAVRRMIGEGQRVLIERAIRQAGGSVDSPGFVDDVLSRFRRHYSAHLVEKTELYPTVRETLARLSPRVPLAVATNKPGEWARRIIATFGLTSHFRWVLGEDDIGARKPDPRLLLTICERAGIEPRHSLMVGDSAIDLAAAHAARMPVAFCTYGFADQATLTAARSPAGDAAPGTSAHPHVLNRFSDLLDLVDFSPQSQPASR